MDLETQKRLNDAREVLEQKVGDDPAGRIALQSLVDIISQLNQDATVDSITRLPNRNAFDSMITSGVVPNLGLMPVPERRKADKDSKSKIAPVIGRAVLLVDLDDFKTVNDTLGHPQGDRMLKLAGFALRKVLRETDPLFRIGGDEFAGVLALDDFQHVGNPAPVAISIERRYREEITHFKECGVDGRYTDAERHYYRLPATLTAEDRLSLEILGASFGITAAPSGEADLARMFTFADNAMYHAKAARKAVRARLLAGSANSTSYPVRHLL